MDVKKRLRELMDERNWSVSQLARESELPRSTVQSLFTQDAEPMVSTLEAICKGLNITVSQFFEEESSVGLNDEERSLIFQWSCLGKREKQIVLELIEVLAHRGF